MADPVSRGDDGTRGFFQIATPRLSTEMTPAQQLRWGMEYARRFALLPWQAHIVEGLYGMGSDPVAPGNLVGKTYYERGCPVLILVQWNGKGPRNVKIRREDGAEVVRPFRGLRKDKPRA